MKIVFLSFYQQTANRGVERFVKELISRLDLKINVQVFSASKINTGFKDYSRSFLRKFFLDPCSLAILRHTIQSFGKLRKYDIIIPLNGGWQSLLTKIFCLFYRKKFIIIGHSGLGYDDRWNLLLKPNLFVVLSKFQKQWAKKYYHGSIEIISNGVDLVKFSPKGKNKKFNLRPPVILCVTSLQKHDFLKNLIMAVSKTKASLVMAGSGDHQQEKYLDSLASKYLRGRYLRKQFKYLEMPAVYRSADLFVYPNPPWESFGLVFLEALACNLPVVASNDPIRKEIIGSAGLFFNPEDYNSIYVTFKKALKENWQDKPRHQAKKYSWDKMALKYLDLFKKLV